MDHRLLHSNSPSRGMDLTSYGKASTTIIDPPLRSNSLSSKETTKSKSLPSHGHCCEASKLAETTTERERTHADVRAHTTNTEILPNHDGGERRRDKVKRFVAKKGPRIAGGAAAVGMFIFNVVTSCA